MYIHDVSVWRVSVGDSHANYYTYLYMYYFISFCFVVMFFFYVLMHFEFCTCVDWNDGIHCSCWFCMQLSQQLICCSQGEVN